MRAWEKLSWEQGAQESKVIARAGGCLAARAELMAPSGRRIVILAGRGHNGDDARHAGLQLRNHEIIVVEAANSPEETLEELVRLLAKRPALLIDGLFGIGLNRELSPAWVRLIESINASGVPILAVDTPSGLNADTGLPMGAAVRATVTITFGAPKIGLLAPSAEPFVGRLEVASEIGLVPCPFQAELNWTLASDFIGFPPSRASSGHKGTYGHAGIIAGSLGYHGAGVLAARGALRARPGLVSLATMPAVYVPVAGQLQAAMVAPWRAGMVWPESVTAILAGPGLAAPGLPENLKAQIREAWRADVRAMIVDASALDWLPKCKVGTMKNNAPRVITPHPGEAARMLGISTGEVQNDRPGAVRTLSRLYGDCWVVLKGHQTIIGRSEGPLFINSTGNPGMAQGGSGDILAGFLAGLLAQPGLNKNPEMAIRHAVWRHGQRADALEETGRNWTIEDLVSNL
jgi:NAD(P)H-hydrate epimerase